MLERAGVLTAIEVKSSRRPETLPGVAAFARAFASRRAVLVGVGGISLEAFLSTDPAEWVAP